MAIKAGNPPTPLHMFMEYKIKSPLSDLIGKLLSYFCIWEESIQRTLYESSNTQR